jgi:hypothetical protein
VTSQSLALSALSLFLLPGCAGTFDGTWLLQWDLETQTVQSTCDISGDQYLGDHYEWMDVYSTTGGALVLTNGDEEYVGAATKTDFKVEAEYFEVVGNTYLTSADTITASLSGKDLTGERTLNVTDGDSDSECRTQTKLNFTGVKMTGTAKTSRTIGTQSSQSASSN